MKKGLLIALLVAGVITVTAVGFHVPVDNAAFSPKPGV